LAILHRKLEGAGEVEEWTRLEADLVLQFITTLFFSSNLIIVFILFWFFFLGVLGGWWKKGGELVARRVVCRWEWWMALLFL
jgi:hypothetical protein